VVRNIESALMAQLGLRVDHRKISIAATSKRPTPTAGGAVIAETASSKRVRRRRDCRATGAGWMWRLGRR
jgi:hypothetical protein